MRPEFTGFSPADKGKAGRDIASGQKLVIPNNCKRVGSFMARCAVWGGRSSSGSDGPSGWVVGGSRLGGTGAIVPSKYCVGGLVTTGLRGPKFRREHGPRQLASVANPSFGAKPPPGGRAPEYTFSSGSAREARCAGAGCRRSWGGLEGIWSDGPRGKGQLGAAIPPGGQRGAGMGVACGRTAGARWVRSVGWQVATV